MQRAPGVDRRPIGVFDSGIGGLTVIRALMRRLPAERIVYLGDTARVPYGIKSRDTIIRYSLENARFLATHQVKAMVVACNTSASYALGILRREYRDIPMIGVIEPGAQTAVRKTRRGVIGVIGTAATVRSGAYTRTILRCAGGRRIRVVAAACPLFVPLIEEGWADRVPRELRPAHRPHRNPDDAEYLLRINHEHIIRLVASEYLLPLKRMRIDTLVLGCTHYPAIKDILQQVIGRDVALVDSAETTAEHVATALEQRGCLNQGSGQGGALFCVTDDPVRFRRIGAGLLQRDPGRVRLVTVEGAA